MPIEVQCPACKTKLRVPDSAAGKTGKCKCGQALKVPAVARPTAAQTPQNMALGSALDSLTANDFQQESPHQKAYAIPKANTDDAKTLKRFILPGTVRPKLSYTTLGWGTILSIVLSFFGGLAYLGLGAAMVAAGAIQNVPAGIEINRTGTSLMGAIFLLLAIAAIAGGVGTLLKTPWGWVLTTTYFVFASFETIVRFAIRIKLILLRTDIPSSYLIGSVVGAAFGALILVAVQYSLFSRRTRYVCGTDTGPWSTISLISGALLFAGFIGSMHLAGALIPTLRALQFIR